ncbi:uncharacterized protein LOC123316500 [Coccinella septempunctata]|uniref:uncharacterized protein LOC123316500 n=1 Tax=Coccinella septempunctata TaxID=41139 RepID=UPI001D080A0D|nr:uncharacterized protein LOC123316500 [Coccinella septempunctata]
MSVNDPAIKDLKGCAQRFLEEPSGKIDDENRFLPSFCQKIETIFYTGLRNTKKYFAREEEPYEWMEEVARDKCWKFPFQYLNSLYEVQKNQCLKSRLGKFRLLLRYCLVNRCLHAPVEYLLKNGKSEQFYRENCILGDEILSEILLSVLLQCGTIKFDLDLSNVYFLESTWLLPDVVRVEVVPSCSLGLSVTFSEEKAVIVNMDPYGPAAESGQVEIGDILESINDVHIDSSSRGKLSCLLKRQKSIPISLTIVKALKTSNNNTLFIPLRKYLLDVNLDILQIQNRKKEVPDEEKSSNISRDGFRCVFVGSVRIGTEGDSRQVEKTIRDIMKYRYHTGDKPWNRFNKHIFLQIGEMAVKVLEQDTGKVLFDHAYMDISSCGSSSIYYNYFGYVKGNDREEPGQFTCYVFYTKRKDDLTMMLSSIGQGFKRTTYAV